MTNILIIEPHEDDALFSVSHLLEAGADLLTVNLRGEGETAKLIERFPKLKHIPLNLPDVNYYKRSTDGWWNYAQRAAIYASFYDTDTLLSELEPHVLNQKYQFIYSPLGIEHPLHILVGEAVRKISPAGLIHYIEYPYWTKKKQWAEAQTHFQIPELIKKDPHPEKGKLFSRIYKSQSAFMRYYYNTTKWKEVLWNTK